MFESLGNRLQSVFDGLQRRGKLTEADVDKAMREVRLALLEADVNFKVVKEFVARVRERAVGHEVMRSLTPGQQVVKIVHDELITTLGEPGRLQLGLQSPAVIMLVGLQGAGKTTMAGKLALHLRKQGRRPLLVAADVYRPAAIDQLQTLGKQLDIPVYDEGPEGNPVQVCANGVKEAVRTGATTVILDTAGRLNIDEMMMDEIKSIKGKVSPVETLLVADAMTGQQAVRVATDFNNAVEITGLIMTKVDGDARGGAAISMREVTGVPIKFLGTGEKLSAIEVFHPDRLANRILGMGDVMSLIERAQEEMDQEAAQKAGEKLMKGEFDLDDFLKQMQQVKRLGPIGQLLEMIPGMGKMTRDVDMSSAEKDMKRIEAIIQSMTFKERKNPKIIKASRKRRIAAGSGTTVQEVNALLKQFREMQKMMKQLRHGKGLGGLSGLLGGRL
ncbi:MAG: signal recognition particle protein [Ardenticatenaceae bacterium]|nr:signal recognition particle protein [Anaerolineales bacterium]MCB8922560.1 signal recognition particle protein [Ardenticatenaceae bacterium]MCB8991228.1 signal recognition particle protein [Ardenticatenaceae bacterium]